MSTLKENEINKNSQKIDFKCNRLLATLFITTKKLNKIDNTIFKLNKKANEIRKISESITSRNPQAFLEFIEIQKKRNTDKLNPYGLNSVIKYEKNGISIKYKSTNSIPIQLER